MKHKSGEPYIEMMPDGSLWEFIDLCEPQVCCLSHVGILESLESEEEKIKQKNKK